MIQRLPTIHSTYVNKMFFLGRALGPSVGQGAAQDQGPDVAVEETGKTMLKRFG